MNWNILNSEEQLETIKQESKNQPVVIFKHSTACNISSMILNRLERSWEADKVPSVKAYFLDLRSYRSVSNSVATVFDTEHESPQMLIIRDGEPVHVTSHLEIDFENVKEVAAG